MRSAETVVGMMNDFKLVSCQDSQTTREQIFRNLANIFSGTLSWPRDPWSKRRGVVLCHLMADEMRVYIREFISEMENSGHGEALP